MPSLAYGLQAYRRNAGGLPELKLINMVVERTPVSRESVALLSRPGMVEHAVAGSGPIDGVHHIPGSVDDALLSVSGDRLFNDDAEIGTISGSGRVTFASAPGDAIIVRGGIVHSTDGVAVTTIATPDSFDAAGAAFLAGLFVTVRADSQRIYWWPVGSAPDGDDYASAETTPDKLMEVMRVRDTLALLGAGSIEFWTPTGDAELPFIRIEERIYTIGIRAEGCADEIDNTLLFVGSDNIVYRGEEVPKRVSDHAIEERLLASEACSAFGYSHEGHSFFVVRLDTETFQLDLATGGWSELKTGQGNFTGGSATRYQNRTIIGDATDGTLWSLDTTVFGDGDVAMERRFSAAAPIEAGAVPINNVRLDADFGRTPLMVGQGSDPQIEMRVSDDGGATFEAWEPETLGRQGEYRSRCEWRALGMFDQPGFLAEFRVTDPVPLRVSSLTFNEQRGGRA